LGHSGRRVTVIVVSSLSWFIGLVLGFLLACAKLSGPRWLKVPVELYIWFFRSVPLMVLLVFVYNLPQLFRPRSRCSVFRLLPD
jgi:polar amino acid transport system permease protein